MPRIDNTNGALPPRGTPLVGPPSRGAHSVGAPPGGPPSSISGPRAGLGTTRVAPPKLVSVRCTSWEELVAAWSEALKWTEGLDRALSVMLASITSVKSQGDQLWIKVIGPPSCGKSVLCEALDVSRHVVSLSVQRGFHSGYRRNADDEDDHSLIAKLYDKTLVTKDGDTLLRAPNRDQILAEARDLYDRTTRVHYRNRINRSYNLNMTWVLCGTPPLRAIDTTELGERFLDTVVAKTMTERDEDEISMRVARRANREVALQAGGKDGRVVPEMRNAMQLTGGYVDYLRAHAQSLLTGVKACDDALQRCARLALFTAFMRTRPSKNKRREESGREMSFRLTSQIVRLAKCLAVVLNSSEIDEEVMRRVRLVALDTSYGGTLDVTLKLHSLGDKGTIPASLALYIGETEKATYELLHFLRRIHVVEVFAVGGAIKKARWRLTSRLLGLCDEIFTQGVPHAES